MDSGCERVDKIVLHKGETAIIYAWSDRRDAIEAFLRQKAESVTRVNKVGLMAESLRENVELDPRAVWQVRVFGRGVYQPVVERARGATRVISICFYTLL